MPRAAEYHRRLAEGMCVECPTHTGGSPVRCQACLEKRYAKRRERWARLARSQQVYQAFVRREVEER